MKNYYFGNEKRWLLMSFLKSQAQSDYIPDLYESCQRV